MSQFASAQRRDLEKGFAAAGQQGERGLTVQYIVPHASSMDIPEEGGVFGLPLLGVSGHPDRPEYRAKYMRKWTEGGHAIVEVDFSNQLPQTIFEVRDLTGGKFDWRITWTKAHGHDTVRVVAAEHDGGRPRRDLLRLGERGG